MGFISWLLGRSKPEKRKPVVSLQIDPERWVVHESDDGWDFVIEKQIPDDTVPAFSLRCDAVKYALSNKDDRGIVVFETPTTWRRLV